jgi:hypothetical protein
MFATHKLIKCRRQDHQNSQNNQKTWTSHEAPTDNLDSNSSMLLPPPQPFPTSPPQVVALAISYLNGSIRPMIHR